MINEKLLIGSSVKKHRSDIAVFVNEYYVNEIVRMTLKHLGDLYNIKIYGDFLSNIYHQGVVNKKETGDILRSTRLVIILDTENEISKACNKLKIPYMVFNHESNKIFCYSNPFFIKDKAEYILNNYEKAKDEFSRY